MTNPKDKVYKMAQTMFAAGKQFYCREWVFHKLQHSNSGNNAGVVSGKGTAWVCVVSRRPGSGKTALSTELLWPSSPASLQRGLHRQALAFHFCRAQDSDTLCVGGFIRGLVTQICRNPAVQSLFQPGECERNPAEAFKRCILLPLLGMKPPQQSLFLLVDSIDEGCNVAEGEQTSTGISGTIAELLADHYEFFPPWLLLLCSARKQSKTVTKMFTGEYKQL
uniref:Nephrocystin 3-like N-terminal domain-containing protein n=1 Tax=Gopherus evgoodei TaxID=1825980 RepID=A0A8C4WIE9_9SAUR